MSKYVVKNPYAKFDSTDVSAYVESVEFQVDADDVDLTTGGSAGWHESGQGLKKGQVVVNLRMDADLALWDAIVWAAFIGSGSMTFEVRRVNDTVSTSNPKWTGNVAVMQAGLAFKVGAALEKSYSFPTQGAVTRATA